MFNTGWGTRHPRSPARNLFHPSLEYSSSFMAASFSSVEHGANFAAHKPGMMTLISLGIIAALGTSLASTFGSFKFDVWWELASLITVMLLGHWLEMRAISQARGALDALAALLPIRPPPNG